MTRINHDVSFRGLIRPMKTIRIKKGMHLELAGRPQARITPAPQISRVAWMPPANMKLNVESLVHTHQNVSAGDYLFIDKNAPALRHVAPASGEISEIVYDQANQLSHVVIELNDVAPKPFAIGEKPYNHQNIRSLMIESGLWTHLRQRPFDTVPSLDSKPDHVLITAMDTRPSAPDARLIIAQYQTEFESGLEALATQTTGTLWVCQSPGDELAQSSLENLKTVKFSGVHPAGTPSLHLQKLGVATIARPSWHIDYQDVIALGFLLLRGHISSTRIVSLSGNQIRDPRLLTTPIGANIAELLNPEIIDSTNTGHTIVGSYLSGQTKAWLGKFDRQITVMGGAGLRPVGSEKSDAADISGFVAEPVFEHINAFNILPVPLLRALVSGDVDLAEKLGCLELSPEDLDMFNYVCPQGNNYSDLLYSCHRTLMQRYSSGSGQLQHAV